MAGAGWFAAACSFKQAGSLLYSVGVEGEGNQLSILPIADQGKGAYITIIESVQGIGRASVAWWGEESPHHLLFQLALNGLEEFRLMWPDHTVIVNVNASSFAAFQSVLVSHQPEEEITPASPYWMDVAFPTPERTAYLLTAPPRFIEDAPRVWGISWVDFFR